MSLILAGKRIEPERQAGFVAFEELRRPWVAGFIVRGKRTIPRVRTELSLADRLGGLKVRWDIGRMDYRVLPGLYAVGDPSADSDVFVTANYKLSFDALRRELRALEGTGAWILALDTKGINVWCAAGKGSFGTEELVGRLAKVKLSELVTHRRLVLPQLGAPGVAAFEVTRRTGFKVEWGPVRAADIPAWLAAGRRKDAAMREVRFDLRDRLAVSPVEIAHGWPVLPGAVLLAALFALPFDSDWVGRFRAMAIVLAGTLPLGALVYPALMPWIPGRAFVLQGALLGLLWSLGAGLATGLSLPGVLAAALVAMPVTGFLAMNFTGSSTFTCQPGALLEVDRSFWPMLSSLAAGLATGALARVLGAA